MATAPADTVTPQDFARARRAMIDSQLRPSGITADWLLDAMGAAPREDYVAADLRSVAYMDRSLPLGQGRAMSSPFAQARLLQEARPRDADRALLIAGGTGYLSALLGPRVATLDVVEPDARLSGACPHNGRGNWHNAPLENGLPDGAPYDLIVIDGAVEALPTDFANQLGDNGRIVMGTVTRGVTRIAIGRKSGDAIAVQPLAEMGFPILSAFAKPKSWSF